MPSMVANIIATFKCADAYQLETGLNWYSDALGIVSDVASAHGGIDVHAASGVFSALSPQNSYAANVNLYRRFMASEGTLDSGYLGDNLSKARRIHAGEDVETTLNGLKTVNFYRSIVSGGEDGVTIDRHAYALAINDRDAAMPRLTPTRYAQVALAYERAGRALDQTPARVQAVTWVVWRQRYWSKGAFDPKA